MINPVASVIQYLSQDADLAQLVEGRIAAKHKFAMPAQGTGSRGWATPSMALQVRPMGGGVPDNYGEIQVVRLEISCYGARPAEAERVYMRVIAICRDVLRSLVQTSEGTALIYDIIMDSSPELTQEQDVLVDCYKFECIASVAEEAVA